MEIGKIGEATGLTVLIADDGDIGRKLLKAYLGKFYKVVEAKSGIEVLNILKAGSYNISCMLLDIL
ncbi:MAG: hypothetical protein IKO40_04000, partial [Kiritimatiellae bacterium]|nr:hypothetical protein [Kiritimatiellia bacterium]